MLKPKKAKRIAKKVASKLAEIKDVKAVGIYGSFAKGYADKFTNDVDLVAFCKKIPKKTAKESKLKEAGAEIIRGSPSVDSVLFHETEITIFYKTAKDARKWINHFKNWDFNESNIAVFIENMIPAADSEEFTKKLKKNISYTNEMRTKAFEWHFYAIARTKFLLENPLKRGNIVFINQKLNESFRSCCKLLYALNKRYFSDTKWINKDLEKFRLKPKSCLDRLEEFSLLGCGRSGIKRKLEILKSLAEETGTIAENIGIDVSRGIKELEKW